jgi:hypothetical protein
MRFYRECLQRHQYARDGGGRYYLSKNPNFSPKIDTLLEWFSDARFIYLARNPLDVIPSYISLLDFEWQVFGRVVPESAGCAAVLDMAEHWYSYPLERLAQTPQERYIVIDFDDMVSNPERTVRRIYERFGLELSPAYAEILWQETIASRHYQSEHDYSLQETGLSREQIVTRFGPVFERFGFDRRVSEDDETVVQVSSAKGLTEKAAQRRKRKRVARRLRFPV